MKLTLIALVLGAGTSLFGSMIGPLTPTDSELVATGGEIVVYFAGHDAAYASVLNVHDPCCAGGFFPNHSTAVGTAFSLGTFDPGTVVRIRLDVTSTGDSFFSGPGSGNPGGIVHVAHAAWSADSTIPADGILVGFEDILGGGDFDYNDNTFVFTQVAVGSPEPASVILIAGGLAALAGLRKRLLTR